MTSSEPGTGQPPDKVQGILVVGDTPVGRRVCATLRELDRPVTHLRGPSDKELAVAMADGLSGAAVLVRRDTAALRYALAIASLSPQLPLSVMIFDRTMGRQLATLLPQATVRSPADLAAPSLIGPCMGPDIVAAQRGEDGSAWCLRQVQSGVVEERLAIPRARSWRRLWDQVALRVHSHDRGTRLLLVGLAGLLAVLLGDWAWLVLVEDHAFLVSFSEAARVVATVGPAGADAGTAYAVLSSLAMLATIVFTAIFTAGAVE